LGGKREKNNNLLSAQERQKAFTKTRFLRGREEKGKEERGRRDWTRGEKKRTRRPP